MQQLITPNPNIPCQPGWCLQYVRQAFDLPAAYPTATAAWEASASKHEDWNFPEGVWFPVWFSLSNEPAGHVALRAPDGSVYSTSDLGSVPHQHPDLADLMRYYAYYGMTLTYLGWTEDVAGYPVITDGGLAAMGSITIQEDDMASVPQQDWDNVKEQIASLVNNAATKKDLNGARVSVIENAQAMHDVTRSHIINTLGTPASIASSLDAAGLAAAVRDELVKLIGGK